MLTIAVGRRVQSCELNSTSLKQRTGDLLKAGGVKRKGMRDVRGLVHMTRPSGFVDWHLTRGKANFSYLYDRNQ